MGIAAFGMPGNIVTELAQLNEARVFVETGTYRGETTRLAARHFDTAYTIERAESLYNLHSPELASLPGVKPLLGDSRVVLPQVVADIAERKAVFWLDGHWSGGPTAGAEDECPLLDELACLAGRTQDIVLIDDARLFLCAPPPPHDPAQWPGISEILNALARSLGEPYVQIIDDVIFAVPNVQPLKARLLAHAQERAGSGWVNQAQQNQSSPRKSRVRRFLGRLAR